MRISAKAEYACLALVELATSPSDGTPRRTREISEAQGIPERYLVHILLQLKAAGLVQSERGAVGGYHLLKRPEEITVAEVIGVIDGHGDPMRKASTPAARELCEVLQRARAAEQSVLASVSIAQLSRTPHNQDWVI